VSDGRRRIGINALFLVPGETGGMETYARQLVPALAEALPESELVAFVGPEVRERLGERPFGASVRVVEAPVPAANRLSRVAAEQLWLPFAARREHIDLLHSLGTTAPGRVSCASVVTVHDVIYATWPEAHTTAMRLGMRVLVPLGLRDADRVVTSAEAAAREIVETLHYPRERIDVVPLGGGLARVQPAPEAEVRARYDLGDAPIVLSVSARRPHKNLPRLLEALAGLRADPQPLLVLPGYATEFEPALEARIGELGVASRVRVLGWIPDADLEGLYAAATCFVFPSLAEGFGLPVLEAMERGVPVACSRASSLPEVGGDAVLYFDPLRVDEIGAATERLLTDAGLRRRLAAAGRERARGFSWQRTARETAAVYDRVLGR
jgi:glycosyltransferase involved in cell wall biosynthesis